MKTLCVIFFSSTLFMSSPSKASIFGEETAVLLEILANALKHAGAGIRRDTFHRFTDTMWSANTVFKRDILCASMG